MFRGRSEMKAFRKETLESHNNYRKVHGSPELSLSDDLNSSAQKWAETLAKKNMFKHSDGRDYGENIGMHQSANSSEFSGYSVSAMWYSEIEKYDFQAKLFRPGTGHFTQLVWKNSKEMGVGKAVSKDNKIIVVAQYRPIGNITGAFMDNVLPPFDGKIDLNRFIGGGGGGGDVSPKKASKKEKQGSDSSSDSSDSEDEDDKKSDKQKTGKRYEDKDVKTRVPRGEQKKFQKDSLEVHNAYRKHHGVPDLELDKKLCRRAKRWAKYLAKNDLFEHSNDDDIGENVAMHYSSLSTDYSGKEACDHWYSELSKYDFDAAGFQKGSGHFTQMVWKGSKNFGIGKAITKDGKVIIVGQYRPPGNVIDHFQENVFKRDDDYVPPPQESGTTRVTRIVRTGDSRPNEVRTVSKEELDETIRRITLENADLEPEDLQEFRKDALEYHNEFRQRHQVNALRESDDLNQRAQDFAAFLAENDKFENSSETDVGENIAMHYNSASTAFSGKDVAEMWYKQKEKYNFKKPGFTKGAGHFTQMVWKDSKEFGLGKAITKEGKVILVGFYKPPGNVMKRFEENVMPEK